MRFHYWLFLLYNCERPVRPARRFCRFMKKIVGLVRHKTRILIMGIRRKLLVPHFNRSSYDFLVISPGGVASTTLLEYFARFGHTNDPYDSDSLKHCPIAKIADNQATKTLFIYGNPTAIYQSIRRRGWVDIQGAKLGGVITAFPIPYLQEWAFKRLVKKQISRWRQYELGAGRNGVLKVRLR